MNITGHTRMGGLLGSPVAHSISPMMHNDSFRQLGIDYVYLCFDTQPEKLASTVQALKDMNAFGFNCTMPLKNAIVPYLDELSEEARLIGAVNTVRIDDTPEGKKLTGFNTDGIGFMRSVRDAGVDIAGKEMILLGAGGAASAIAVQAALDGARKLHLVNRRSRSWAHAEELVRSINAGTSCQADLTDLADTDAIGAYAEQAALLVNGTNVGMEPHIDACPLPESFIFPRHLTVGDVIYNPRQTMLLQRAAAAGCRTFNGMYMLLYQGEACFRIWTGQDMPTEMIRERYFS